jgi:hypothetical protein
MRVACERLVQFACASVCTTIMVACSSSPTNAQASKTPDSGANADATSIADASPDTGTPQDSGIDADDTRDAGSPCADDAGTLHLANFATAPYGPGSIFATTADSTAVYVVLAKNVGDSDASLDLETQVVRVPIDCGTVTVLASRPVSDAAPSGPTQALVAGDRVYLAMPDGVFSIPTAGGNFTKEAALTCSAFAVAGGQIGCIDANGAVWVAATGGTGTPQPIQGAPVADGGIGAVTSIAIDTTNVYIAERGQDMVPLGDGGVDAGSAYFGSIVAFPIAGGTGTQLATNLQQPEHVTVGGDTLYWTDDTFNPPGDTAPFHGPIMGVTLPSGTPRVVVLDAVAPTQLLRRGSTLFWFEFGGPDGIDAVRTLVDADGGASGTVPTPNVQGPMILGPNGAYWIPISQELLGVSF